MARLYPERGKSRLPSITAGVESHEDSNRYRRVSDCCSSSDGELVCRAGAESSQSTGAGWAGIANTASHFGCGSAAEPAEDCAAALVLGQHLAFFHRGQSTLWRVL